MKNPTPRYLAFIAGLIVSIIVTGVVSFTFSESYFSKKWISMLVVFGINFTATFFLFNFLIERFLYRKIKVIYKTLSAFKNINEKELSKLELNNDILGNVNQEVKDWEKNRNDEIDVLKRNEVFRKEFLGNVSHELKTPLFNIQGYIHTLLEGGLDDPEVNVHYLQRAAKSAERLCLIVDDLESISKLEAGELILEQRIFDLVEFVKDVFDSLELKAKDNNINFLLKENDYGPIFVNADKERLRQVFINLIVNSIKYGRSGGTTTISFEDLHEKIFVEVSDNGIGINQEHLSRLFERFYRVDKSRSRDQGGTGLGLSIVKHILEAHKQTISVRSTDGIGTTFSFTLSKAD